MKTKPIVLATDGSPSAAEATLHAVDLAQRFDVPLVAVAVEHVTVPSYGYFGYSTAVAELEQMEKEHVDETLAQAAEAAAEAGVPCETVHRRGNIPEEICAVARDRDAELIVIGAHGWGAIGRLLHGSVSSAVLHEAPCPVLVVRDAPGVEVEPSPAHHEAGV